MEMNKINILFDFDSVIVRSVQAFVMTYINKHYDEIACGLKPYPDFMSVKRWDMQDELPLLTNKELLEIFESNEFFNNLPFISDSNGYSMFNLLKELHNMDEIILHVASKGTNMNLAMKHDFIQRNLPFFDINNFHPMLGTDMNKSSLLDNNTFYIAIDDNQDNLISLQEVPNKILYADKGVRAEWNDRLFDNPNYNRCESVRELRDKIYGMLGM